MANGNCSDPLILHILFSLKLSSTVADVTSYGIVGQGNQWKLSV
jgi:hypothetical protein